MNSFLQGFLDNDSFFGRFMTKLGIIIAANILFCIASVPFVTIGAGFAGLYHVMLKTLRSGGVCNPFKQFWIGFKSNFRQATISWLVTAAIIAFLVVDLKICDQAEGAVGNIRVGIYAIMVIVVALYLYLMPTMAAFYGTIKELLKDSLYFIVKKPWKFLVIAFFDIFPLVLTYTDAQYQPLYGFIWVFCGFGLQAMLASRLLLPEFRPFLDQIDESGGPIDPGDDEESMMRDLRELDGL